MSLKSWVLAIPLALAPHLFAQGLASYFPASSQSKAARLLGSVDQASRAIEAKRAEAWKAESAAEAEAVQAYALVAASVSGREPWASPDGSAKSSEGKPSLKAARARAKDAALSLASGADGSASILKSRDTAAQSLASLIRSSGMGPKNASALERKLSASSRALRLFPEIAEVTELLRRSGGAGAREAAAAASQGNAEGTALSLIASKARIIALAPEAEAPLALIDTLSRAYRSWIAAFPYAAYPSEAFAVTDIGAATAAAGIEAIASLGPNRSALLFDAMAKGDGRDAAAAQAARRLAEAWLRSPEPRRRSLAILYGLPESTMARFSFGLEERKGTRPPSPGIDAMACLRALNGLASEIAAEEERKGAPDGAEPCLLLLERPEFARLAASEGRYAILFAEASRRLGGIYMQAARDASSMMEESPSLARAATRALGSSPASLNVRAVDLSLPPEDSGRLIAFIATANDASGYSLCFPVDAGTAGRAYASAFARASGIDASPNDPAAFLEKYGQKVLSAYDPEGCGDNLAVGAFPSAGAFALLGPVDLELALLEGGPP